MISVQRHCAAWLQIVQTAYIEVFYKPSSHQNVNQLNAENLENEARPKTESVMCVGFRQHHAT